MRYLTTILTGMLLGPAAAGSVIHVDDDAAPGGDGSTWSTAYGFLQDALDQALDADEIRVAQGTYRPDRSETHPGGTGDRAASFILDGGIALRGGFAGLGASDPDEREITLFETILDGDLAGDDGPVFASRGDNAYHVVSAMAGTTASLDGFTVRGGNADGGLDLQFGGGLYAVGAGPAVSGCTFTSNWAGTRGGAVYVEDGWARFEDCVLTSNYGDIGGAMQIRGPSSNVEIVRCAFKDNEAHAAGGIFKLEGALSLIECAFTSNVVTGDGGALFNGHGMTAVASCVFSNNQASFHSGAAAFVEGDASLVNCVFSENASSLGAVYCANTLPIDNCTFSRNSVGGLIVGSIGYPDVTNSIFWGNQPFPIGTDPGNPGSVGTVSFSDVEGGWAGSGGDNIDADPLFVQAGTGNVRLAEGSPCLDAGSTADLPADELDLDGDGDAVEPLPVDLDGNPRVQAAAVDMGAYEGAFAAMPAGDGATGLDPGEFAVLVPDGGPFNPVLSAAVIVSNVSGPEDASFSVTLHEAAHPAAQGYSEVSVVLTCETSMAPGQFLANLFIPFSGADLNGAEWSQADLTAFDPAVGNWALAVAGNTANSPGFGGPIGDRVQSMAGWGNTQDLGDYGVFWNPPTDAGFVWANVDRAGEIAVGTALCPADCLQTPDGVVGVVDFLALLASWGGAAGGGPCDVNYDGAVGEADFLAQLAAWGPCPAPMSALPSASPNPRDQLSVYARWGES